MCDVHCAARDVLVFDHAHYFPTRSHRLNNDTVSEQVRPLAPSGEGSGEEGAGDGDGARVQTVKCRKFFGLMRKSDWCTKCRWKKACERVPVVRPTANMADHVPC